MATVMAIIAWISANWGTIATILLMISELLAVAFPASTGFGGFVAGLIKFLQGLGAKTPPAPPAAS